MTESPASSQAPDDETVAAPAPLLTLRDGLTPVIDTDEALAAYAAQLAVGTGPVAIDAERASGYRYSARAYLVQLRREGAGTALVDPIGLDMAPLVAALEGTEWILHAATQDLACLAELGLHPASLFDTELAGRLLGYPRVGLATLVEELLGQRMRKEHSAADWSRRPLPESWLEYAALDVEVLVELRALMATALDDAGKSDWAHQEFEHLLGFKPTVRVDPWRRTSQMHRVRSRHGLAAVKLLWEARNEIAAERDVTPGKIIPDSAIVEAAIAMPQDRAALLALKGFHGRGAERYSTRWIAAIREAAALPEAELPPRTLRGDGPPVPRAWAEKDPVAARRLTIARDAIAGLGEQVHMPVEQLLTPDFLRRVLWTPPRTRQPEELLAAVGEQLSAYGARPWQIELTGPVLRDAIIAGDVAPPEPTA
ncbi:HRDC domain-containing protein [Nocardioides jejuensis]|uniref:Ribonuclease D n=1 Tax=Nocardioides jejuensis TaxID=2502782 RepID=A0A4R1CCV6_9ACTN|nr:ribonuclease D [Nocardioides jejuensis]TCJ28561.1 ribonuclease D [Nocardioides jejuensis]